MRSALADTLHQVGCMIASLSLFCGLWNLFRAYAGPPYEAPEGLSVEAASACAFAFGAVLVVLLAWMRKRRGDAAAAGVSQVLDAGAYPVVNQSF